MVKIEFYLIYESLEAKLDEKSINLDEVKRIGHQLAGTCFR